MYKKNIWMHPGNVHVGDFIRSGDRYFAVVRWECNIIRTTALWSFHKSRYTYEFWGPNEGEYLIFGPEDAVCVVKAPIWPFRFP